MSLIFLFTKFSLLFNPGVRRQIILNINILFALNFLLNHAFSIVSSCLLIVFFITLIIFSFELRLIIFIIFLILNTILYVRRNAIIFWLIYLNFSYKSIIFFFLLVHFLFRFIIIHFILLIIVEFKLNVSKTFVRIDLFLIFLFWRDRNILIFFINMNSENSKILIFGYFL